jgi:glycogen debranching enzyme
MSGGIRIPHPLIILHGQGVALACDMDGQMHADQLHGLFAGDTRVLSTYRLGVNGHAWRLLGRSRSGHGTAQWEFQNPAIRDPEGEVPAGSLLLSLRRRLDGALHDDLSVHAFGSRRVHLQLTLQLDADFSDLFEVKSRSIPPRLNAYRAPIPGGIAMTYARGDFHRGLEIRLGPSHFSPVFVGALLIFELDLDPSTAWTCCLEATPVIGDKALMFSGDPHAPEPDPVPDPYRLTLETDPILVHPFRCGRADLHALAVPQAEDPPYIAAGVPWFMTLFGRDPLMTALMSGLDGAWSAEGTLAALGRYQADKRDDFRDAEPGKLPHELRQDELTAQGVLPYAPYYGTHDAPSLILPGPLARLALDWGAPPPRCASRYCPKGAPLV